MDVYDFTKNQIEKVNQKKLLITTIIVASVLIILTILFIIYAIKAANNDEHIFSFSQKRNEIRQKEIEERHEKMLEDPAAQEVHQKFFVDRDFSF